MTAGCLRFCLTAWSIGAAFALAALALAPARADTLESALAAAYQNSPAINAERARLRATDEELAKAQSGYRPSINIDADLGLGQASSTVTPLPEVNGVQPTLLQNQQNAASFRRYDGDTRPGGFAVTVSQPLFEGFRVANSVKQADASIMAAREALRDVEQKTLLETTRVYADVLRDAANMALRQHSRKLLETEASATKERFAAGEMTRTDVSQALAREAEARAAFEAAKANLRGSLASYQRLVGHVPVRLTNPAGFEQLLPTRIDDAISAALSHNPQVVGAAYLEKAANFDVKRTLGEMLPQVRLQASHNERFYPSTVLYQQTNETASVRVSIPIYQAGDVEARVRQAKQQHQGRIQEIEGAREQAQASAISAFAEVQAMRAEVAALRLQVQATTDSLAGVREEQKAGQRTLLDVLNAEQEQTNARVSLVQARHDMVIAAYTLLSAMGRLTAADLGLGVQLYDAQKHYAETNGKWSGTGVEREPASAGQTAGWGSAVQAQH